MNKLPSIFHNNIKFKTNNKNSFNTFKNEKTISNNNVIDNNNLINYFNKKICVELKSGNVIEGVLISKRGNTILLDTKDYINISDIVSIK